MELILNICGFSNKRNSVTRDISLMMVLVLLTTYQCLFYCFSNKLIAPTNIKGG